MKKRDYYEVLGIQRTATAQEIKTAYRKLAVQYHPDRNPDDHQAEEKFKELAEAYAVLSEPDKRTRYDRFGHGGLSQSDMDYDINDIFSGFTDIFDAFFGGGGGFGTRGRGRTRTRGNDLQYTLAIDFEEAYSGSEKTIRLKRNDHCDSCGGTGAEPGSDKTACPTCRGRGSVHYRQGFFTMSRTCSTCGGDGMIIENPCKSCEGQGRTLKEKEVTVKIPAGVDDGDTLRVAAGGEAGLQGGPHGDLYIVLRVKEHPIFQRAGSDVRIQLPISFADAALGLETEVPSPGGRRSLNIPAGIQSGTVLELKGDGFPRVNSSHVGSLMIEVVVRTPRSLTDEQRELFEHLREIGDDTPSLWDRVKDLFAGKSV